MAYDINKWHANEMQRRPRRAGTRWLLTLGLCLILAMPVIEMYQDVDRGGLLPNVLPSAIVLIVASTLSPFMRDAFLTDRGFARYDEFERGALLAALRRSYLVMVILVAALFVWLIAGTRLGWPVPQFPRQWGAIGFATIMTMLTLPVLFAEFMVPMPDPEDDIF